MNRRDVNYDAELEVLLSVITIRNLPPHLDRAIQKQVRTKNTSVNKAVIGLLEEYLESSSIRAMPVHHVLDDLAGVWTKEEAAEFGKKLTKQRAIDSQLWK